MKKYKLIIQIEQIKKYLEQGQLKEAYDLAENVDIKKLKSISDLGVIAECYFQNKKYVEAKELFEQIYDTVRTRRVLAQIVHLSIKLKDIIEANYYLEEFIKIAPDDFYQYIFRYSIDKLMKKPIDVLIADLEKLKEVEYIECWAYELAKLYYKSGNEAACRKECEKIILWFGNGEYVDRAKALLAFYNGELDLELLLDASKQKDSENKENGPNHIDKHVNEVEENTEYENLEDRCAEEISYQIDENKIESKDNSPKDRNDIKVDDFDALQNNLGQDDGAEEDWELEHEELGNEMIEPEEVFQEELIQEKIELEEGLKEELEQEEGFKVEIGQEEIEQKLEAKKSEQDMGLQAEKIQNREEQANIIIPPGFGKSKHKLFHKKYDQQEANIGMDDSTKVKTCDETIIGEDTEADSKSLIHIELKSNAELIDNLQSKLLPLLEEKNISLSEIFGNFMRIDGLKENILQSIESMIHSVYGHKNLVIMGSKDSGKTLLAKKYAKLLHRLSFISSPRVALIDAKKLNQMDFISKSHQLKDCIMILQSSQNLTRDTLIRLIELQQIPGQNIIYMLTGLSEEMEQLWEENEDLINSYPLRILLPQYKVEDYLGFSYDKICEVGYKIEKDAFDYLRDVILDKIKIKRENILSEVFSYLNQIILDHEKQNEQVLLELTRKGNLDQFDLTILKKEDIK
ncbi:tetratricopeptide repeat protein [Lachnoclostridium phytofermentans]|uniref:Uncharacterized protein n=1 Tax=Lachnoclostridium phytofermentans (strain ATCC 700394 / DSM 18823 / ISDg) TaxID=357809 RepID=A9KL81_LACP7|nr:hypothetical protein [Lachnoclostridium phytofermentans]ABX44230.1 hypothetical protein Cphy_3883 [Lachnoclostridium phytofermentans ISDg]